MNGDVIKSFLVGLGFGVDDASLAKFNKAIASATLKVAALYGSIKVTSAGIVYGLSQISEGFEKMGYEYRIIAPAINKALVLRRELLKAYSLAGINIVKVVQSSVRLNLSLTKTKYAFEAIYRSVASRFFDTLARQSDLFRQKIYANMPKIQAALENFVKAVFRALEVTLILGNRLWQILTRVYDFFALLDAKTSGWSTAILAAAAAWRFLNLSFLATPLGLLLVGFTALLALWDDFKTFQEGGQALINWGSETTRIMVGLAGAIGGVAVAVGGVILAMRAYAVVQAIVNAVMFANPIGLIIGGVIALTALLTYLDNKWQLFGGHISGFFSGLGGKILDFASGTNVAANAANNPATNPLANPIGSAVNHNSQTNQNVSMQNNFNVVGVSDPGANAKAIAGEQTRVAGAISRNLNGKAAQ